MPLPLNKVVLDKYIRSNLVSGIKYPVHEKGDAMMCNNCRTVTLLCKMYKILGNILYLKLVTYAEEIIGEYQEGFQRGRSTVDQIITVRQILEKCWEQNIAVHNLFIDFQTANNTVIFKWNPLTTRPRGRPKH